MIILTVVLISVLYVFKLDWWYDTLLAYPAGAFVALRKDCFFELTRKHYWAMLATSLLSFVLFINVGFALVLIYNVASVMFAILLVVITMRIKLQNGAMIWLGASLFSLYIYQRVPMMVTTHLFPSFVASQASLFCVICFVITVAVVYAYKYVKISVG